MYWNLKLEVNQKEHPFQKTFLVCLGRSEIFAKFSSAPHLVSSQVLFVCFLLFSYFELWHTEGFVHVSDLCSGRWITSCAEQSLLPKPPFLWDTELGGTWDERVPELRGGQKLCVHPRVQEPVAETSRSDLTLRGECYGPHSPVEPEPAGRSQHPQRWTEMPSDRGRRSP